MIFRNGLDLQIIILFQSYLVVCYKLNKTNLNKKKEANALGKMHKNRFQNIQKVEVVDNSN